MHRNKLREMIKKYESVYAKEIESKSRMLDFLDKSEDCFKRSLEEGHFTGSAWLVNSNNTKFLLTLHKKVGLWMQLGGHADGDNDLARVALKEAYEESGLQNIQFISNDIFDIDVHFLEAYKGVPPHYHYDVRFILRADSDNIQISDESEDLQWFSTPPVQRCGDIARMYEKWKKFFSESF